jgi:hypothetical protein
MLAHVATVILAAAEAGKEEKSHVPFYICGGLLAVWAVVVSVIGFTRPDFPASQGQQRGAMLLTAVLVVASMATAVLTAG